MGKQAMGLRGDNKVYNCQCLRGLTLILRLLMSMRSSHGLLLQLLNPSGG